MSTDAAVPARPATLDPDERVLALDCGQSSTRGRVLAQGQVVASDIALPAVRTDHSVVEQLAAFVREVSASQQVDAVALGVSGLTDDDTADDLVGLVAEVGVRRVALAHDSVTSYLGALGDQPGVVTAAGTGVVTLAVGRSTTARVDGWGYIMGDNGSGWWIGRAGLDAGMRAFDGREAFGRASAGMLDVIRSDFGDPAGAYMVLQADPGRVQRVGGYARTVLDLADTGDAACLQIADDAALEMAVSASAALRRVGETNQPRAAVLGGLFGSRVLREAFQRHLEELAPGAELVVPRGAGLDGATELAALPEVHPLRDMFTEAQA